MGELEKVTPLHLHIGAFLNTPSVQELNYIFSTLWMWLPKGGGIIVVHSRVCVFVIFPTVEDGMGWDQPAQSNWFEILLSPYSHTPNALQ